MTGRFPYGKTTYHKCPFDGCTKIVKQTASQKRNGRGIYCSKKHTPKMWKQYR